MPPRPELFDFHRVTMAKFFTDNWDNIQNFRARSDDVVLASYPKAGNTWVSYILDLTYFSKKLSERQESTPLFQRVPFLEFYMSGYPSGPKHLLLFGNRNHGAYDLCILLHTVWSKTFVQSRLRKLVTEKVQFDNIKTNKMVNGSTDVAFDFKISPFLRKGKVGDWKNHFTAEQGQQFTEDYEKKMKNIDLQFRTVL
ncbi:cytosolic sulfotransferase 2-like [Pholidichthys leucotaenia]